MTLRALREARGLTQEQVAEAAFLTQSHVSALELGKLAQPKYQTVARLAKALDTDPETIHQAIQATIAA